mgnify:CR=1 FL=1
MIGKTPTEHQMTIFETALESFIDMNHELVLLARRIDWSEVEREFSKYYCKDNGRPSVPARKMVGLMYLKNLYNLSDEGVVARWLENPYMQYFTGEKVFQKRPPIDPADFAKFRKRIGPEGAEILFRISLCVNAEELTEKEMERVLIDSTVQEKNITYPTDAKLLRKIVDKVLKIAETEDITLRRTYTREMKALKLKVRFMNHPKRRKEGEKAVRRMRTIAGAMVRDLDRKLNDWQRFMYGDNINLWIRVINQKRSDKDKIYSLHEPEVSCIAKGKQGKKYEFGSKASLAITRNSAIIIGVANFQGNPYDGDTLKKTIENIHFNLGKAPAGIYADRGYRGREYVETTQVFIPQPPKKDDTPAEKKKARKNFGRRSAIEPVISHVKHDHRLCRNYLKGEAGDAINLYLAAAGFNLRKWMGAFPHIFILLFFRFYGFRFIPERTTSRFL